MEGAEMGDCDVQKSGETFRTARSVKQKLDELVVGQKEAKERLSLLFSMHFNWLDFDGPGVTPPNGIVIGPTGSGKTFSVQVASRELGLNFINVDSTVITPSGARNGLAVDDLYRTATSGGRDNRKSIIFFDEFDKIAAAQNDQNMNWKLDIQRALLKFIEGSLQTHEDPHSFRPLIIAGGAFVGIDGSEIIRKRKPEVAQLLRRAPKGTIAPDDLVNFGFIPELVARLPAIIQFDALDEGVLLEILQHPITSPLLLWTKHFENIGKTLRFTEEFMRAVAKRATALQMGARGLQQIVFPALARHAYSFEEDSRDEILITEDVFSY